MMVASPQAQQYQLSTGRALAVAVEQRRLIIVPERTLGTCAGQDLPLDKKYTSATPLLMAVFGNVAVPRYVHRALLMFTNDT
jgi:hypothetical protein